MIDKKSYFWIGVVILGVIVLAVIFISNSDDNNIELAQNETVEDINYEGENIAKTLSFSWEKDSGSRIVSGSVPFVHNLEDAGVRLYYCDNDGIQSAISVDGLTFTKEHGIRVSPGIGFESIVCDPTIVNLPNGKIRMYYKGADSMMGDQVIPSIKFILHYL